LIDTRLRAVLLLLWLGSAGGAVTAAPDADDEPPLPEANAFLKGLADTQRAYEKAIDDYTYDVLEVEQELDAKGAVRRTRTRRFEVFHVEGRPVRRMVADEGLALSAEQLAEEDERVRKQVQKIRKKSAEPGEVKLSAVLERFDFRSVAREPVEGRRTLAIGFAPRPGKRDLKGDNVLRALNGRLWVDEETRAIVRVRMRNGSSIKFGLGLGASLSDVELSLDFQKVDEVWLPRRAEAYVAGKLLLLKRIRQRTVASYENYRRFQISSEEELRPES